MNLRCGWVQTSFTPAPGGGPTGGYAAWQSATWSSLLVVAMRWALQRL